MNFFPRNPQRAATAAEALSAYILAKCGHPDELIQSPQEWLTDLLTDLRHHAAELLIDFDAAVRMSEYHFEEEASAAS